MTTRIVDRAQLARLMEKNRVTLERLAKEPGQAGVSARFGLATFGSDAWAVDEVDRGTPDTEIVVAVIERAASMVIARSVGLPPLSREACIAVLCSTIRRGLEQFDEMPAERLAEFSAEIHPLQ